MLASSPLASCLRPRRVSKTYLVYDVVTVPVDDVVTVPVDSEFGGDVERQLEVDPNVVSVLLSNLMR